MITYLKHNQIDKKKWDETIANSHNKLVYACSWYLDCVSQNWEALVLENYEAVMPLTHSKKYGVKYLYQPYFTQQLGVFSKNKITESIVHKFLDSIPNEYQFVEIKLNTSNNVSSSEFKTSKNINFELPLHLSYYDIKNNFSTNTIRNIKKATKNNLTIYNSKNTETTISLFKKNKGREVTTLKSKHYKILENIIATLNKHKALHIYEVKNEINSTIAGALFIEYFDRLIFLFSGNSAEGKEKGAMAFLISQIIKENCNKNIIFDFEGSNDKNLARFYRSFGPKECVYLQVKRNRLSKIIQLFKK